MQVERQKSEVIDGDSFAVVSLRNRMKSVRHAFPINTPQPVREQVVEKQSDPGSPYIRIRPEVERSAANFGCVSSGQLGSRTPQYRPLFPEQLRISRRQLCDRRMLNCFLLTPAHSATCSLVSSLGNSVVSGMGSPLSWIHTDFNGLILFVNLRGSLGPNKTQQKKPPRKRRLLQLVLRTGLNDDPARTLR